MRALLIPVLIAVAAPAAAQPTSSPPPAAQMQQVLNDPAMADRLSKAMQVMSRAFLDMPAGEIQAALEGRQPTAAEKRATVRDLARRGDPQFDRNFQAQVANARPMIEQGMKALSSAMPALMENMQSIGKAMERAAANVPDPTYPKR